MAYLNKQERDALLDDIKDKSYRQIRGYLYRKDKKARIAYFRNAQTTGKWETLYVLPTYGTRVTLVEAPYHDERSKHQKFALQEIIVEPTEDNRL